MERKPILTRAAVVSVVGLVVTLLRHAGLTVPEDVAGLLVDAVLVLGPLALAWWAQRHTTPVADPRDTAGRPLVTAPVWRDDTAPAATAPGCQHPDCVLTHPHAGPAVLSRR